MSNLDTLGWVFIGGALLCYAKQSRHPEKQASTTQVGGEDQIDLTRWLHNGEQPTFTKLGNQAAIEDNQVQEVLAYL